MGSETQTIIVGIVIIAAVVWSIRRLFFSKKCGCGCEDGSCAGNNQQGCSGCLLSSQCNKKVSK